MNEKKKLVLIDGNSVAYRAFFALHSQLEKMKNKNGLHTNALYGFHNMIDNVLTKEKPTHALVAFDAGNTTFRHSFFDDYKAGRSKTPGEFSEQMPYLRDMLDGFGIKHYELENFEADDIIGTLSAQVDSAEYDVVVVSGDRDLTQLAKDNVRVDITVKGVSELKEYTVNSIQEEMGISPLQIIDMKGLAGDASDNIPGVTKIGEKTALKLLKEYGSVEGIYENIETLKKSKMKENLINEKETALSKLDTSEYDAEQNTQKAEISYKVVTDITKDMFNNNMALYVELMGDNYHTSPIFCIGWGDDKQIYIAEPEVVFASEDFKNWAKEKSAKKQVFDAKRTYIALKKQMVEVQSINFDILLASYLLNTKDNSKDLSEVATEHDY